MKRPFSPILYLFLTVAAAGLVMTALSFTPIAPDAPGNKTLRAFGLFCLLLGIGEYLNHPLQEERRMSENGEAGVSTRLTRKRNPCALGNFLDVLAIICLFASIATAFFPYQDI